MADFSLTMIHAKHLVQAAQEHDELGREQFLVKYGFCASTKFFYRIDGNNYDAKAMVGAAAQWSEIGRPLKSTEFSGGAATCGAIAKRQGIEWVSDRELAKKGGKKPGRIRRAVGAVIIFLASLFSPVAAKASVEAHHCHALEDQAWYNTDATQGPTDPTFLLGVPEPSWAWNGRAKGPLFISATRLSRRVGEFPGSTVPVMVDSGGFNQITDHGRYIIEPPTYVDLVDKVRRSMMFRWAAVQDWMCEDAALARTGLTVVEHQERTIASFDHLTTVAPHVRWLPVVQGRTPEDYARHVQMYRDAGIDLTRISCVGVGSVCRRQATAEIVAIVSALNGTGLKRLHGFGVKSEGLRKQAPGGSWATTDSQSWSYDGRRLNCKGWVDRAGRNLANSQDYAEAFRAHMQALISGIDSPRVDYQLQKRAA